MSLPEGGVEERRIAQKVAPGEAEDVEEARAVGQPAATGQEIALARLQVVDRRDAQPARRPIPLEHGELVVAPRTPIEGVVAEIWGTILERENVSIHDNFFELGGNSLLGMELIAQAKKIFGVTDLPAYILYEAPSVSTMARHFDSVVGTRLIASASSGVEATGNTRARSERRRESLNQRARETRRAR